MSFRFLPDAPASAVRMPVGQTVLLDPALHTGGSCIEVLEGMARVYCPCEETEGDDPGLPPARRSAPHRSALQ